MNLSATVAKFYEAAGNADLWPEALADLSALARCRGALLTTPVFIPGGLVHTRSLEEAVGPHHVHNGFVSDHTFFSDSYLQKSEYYEKFARKADVPWFAAAHLIGQMSGDTVSISLQRSAREGAFSPGELTQLNDLVSHLAPAMILASKLVEMRGRSLLEGLQLARQPAILVRPNGSVAFLNAAAEALLGDRLLVRRQRLAASDAAENRQLQSLIEQACLVRSHDLAGSRILRPVVLAEREGGGRLIVTAAPITRSASDIVAFSGAILMLTDLNSVVEAPRETLQLIFDLTKREAEIMSLLGQGRTLVQIGTILSIALETVRYHVKTLFMKTGTARQSELVALCLRMPPANSPRN